MSSVMFVDCEEGRVVHASCSKLGKMGRQEQKC
jgi:hypothetical protein